MKTLFCILAAFTVLSVHAQQKPVTYTNPSIESSDEYTNGNLYQKDFLLFADMLNETHPAFAPNEVHPFNPEVIKKEGYKWSAQCKSASDLSFYIQSILSQLNDGHSLVNIQMDNNKIYPFGCLNDGDKVYLSAVQNNFASSLGKQITAINNKPISEVISSFRNTLSSENDINFLNQLLKRISFFSLWQNTPYRNPDNSLKITFADNSDIELSPISRSEFNISSVQGKGGGNTIRRRINSPYDYRLLPEKKICHLQFNQCADGNPKFTDFLDEMFASIKSNGIKTLVVDVRNNGGGNSMLCDQLLMRLKNPNEIKQGSASMRFSKLWEQQAPSQVIEYSKNILNSKSTPYVIGRLYPNSELSNASSDINPDMTIYNDIFTGNVVFIQNQNTFSSAGLLIINAIDNNIGIVIGSESSYRPCNYGDMLTWALPNTGINGYVSHKIFYRPDNSKCGETSIKPQVELPSDYSNFINGTDACWEWVLNNY